MPTTICRAASAGARKVNPLVAPSFGAGRPECCAMFVPTAPSVGQVDPVRRQARAHGEVCGRLQPGLVAIDRCE